MISNTEQLGQQIREQYAPQDNRSFTSTLMRFAVSQVSEYVFKEVIEPLTEQLSTNALSGTRVDQKLDDIDKHIIELGEKFKSLTFYPSPQHSHSIRTDTNYVTQPSNNSRMANEFRLLHELKRDYQQIKERTTSNLVAGGFRELNSPIIESAITKSIEYYKKYKASKESRTSSSDSSNQTANSTFTSSTSDIVSLLMQRQEDNEDDRTETQENELLDAINKELKLDTKLLKQIERNTANISLSNASSNGGLLSSVSDIAGNLLGGKGDKIKNLGKSGLAKAGGLLSRGGTALAGIASSISLPLLAAGSAAVIGGGTGLSAIIKGIQGDDASNWISNGVDGTLSKITGKDASLGTMIYDMFHSDNEQLNNIVLKPNSSSALESHNAQTSSSNAMNTGDTTVSNTSSNNQFSNHSLSTDSNVHNANDNQFSTSTNNHSLSTDSNVHNANTSSSTDNQFSTSLTDTSSAMSTNADNQFSTSTSNTMSSAMSANADNQFSTSTSNTMSSSLSEQTINSITADNVSSLSINADSKMLNISPSHINDERTISSIEHNIVEKEQHKEPIIINNTQPQQQVNTQPPNRGQDVVPVITRSNYSSLSRVSDSMIGISLRG